MKSSSVSGCPTCQTSAGIIGCPTHSNSTPQSGETETKFKKFMESEHKLTKLSETEDKERCKTCGSLLVYDWGEGMCIHCKRDETFKPVKTGDRIGKYIACVGGDND